MSFQTENMRLESMGDRLTSHKISKYIDYPNMKELFLSLQRRKGDSLREWSMWHFYNAAACGANIPHDA